MKLSKVFTNPSPPPHLTATSHQPPQNEQNLLQDRHLHGFAQNPSSPPTQLLFPTSRWQGLRLLFFRLFNFLTVTVVSFGHNRVWLRISLEKKRFFASATPLFCRGICPQSARKATLISTPFLQKIDHPHPHPSASPRPPHQTIHTTLHPMAHSCAKPSPALPPP